MDSLFAWWCVICVALIGASFHSTMEELEQGVICKDRGGVLVTQLDGTYICAKLEVIK